jgi:hypothetical protein
MVLFCSFGVSVVLCFPTHGLLKRGIATRELELPIQFELPPCVYPNINNWSIQI